MIYRFENGSVLIRTTEVHSITLSAYENGESGGEGGSGGEGESVIRECDGEEGE